MWRLVMATLAVPLLHRKGVVGSVMLPALLDVTTLQMAQQKGQAMGKGGRAGPSVTYTKQVMRVILQQLRF